MLRISMVTEHHPGELRIIQGKNSPISLFHCTQQRKQQLDYSSYVTVMSCRWNVNAQRTSLTFLKVFSVSPTSNRGVVYPRGRRGAPVHGLCPAGGGRLSYLLDLRAVQFLGIRYSCAQQLVRCHHTFISYSAFRAWY